MEVAVDGGSGRRWWRSTGKDERGGWKVIWLVVWGRGEQCSTCLYVVLCDIRYRQKQVGDIPHQVGYLPRGVEKLD